MSQTTTPPNAPDHGCSCGRPDCQYDKAWGNPLRETKPAPDDKPNEPEVDVLAVLAFHGRQQLDPLLRYDRLKDFGELAAVHDAVAALLTREAALVAEVDLLRRVQASMATEGVALVADRDALIDERDQLNSDYLTAINAANVIAAENKAMQAILEEIAAGWDGCYYEANPVYGDDNKPMSIGDRIRSSAGRLLRAAIALTPAKESNDGYDFLHELRQACVLAGLYRATVQGDEYKPVELSYIDAIEEKAIAKVAELHAADKDFDSANAAVGQAMLGAEEARALAMSAWIKAYKRRAAAIRAFEGRV